MADFLFRGSLADLDPEIYELTRFEEERQYRKLILIPSESCAPLAVREALGSVFQNLYAEGYPDEEMRGMMQDEILDYPARLADYRRYADARYYKGVEYVDIVESLARRRCAEVFATGKISADQLYVNVQPLSGAPANNAVYQALVNPGDTVMGMNLMHGGHLTHGSPVNRSGKLYNIIHYAVDPETEQINYDTVATLAQEHKPKIIIAGYSSYPWAPDWARFRAIADSVGAVLLADISHIAGLVIAGAVSSPVGYAQVITFTTHKTLFGPRGACILCQDASMARKIDRAVFPGEQGGPHIHAMAAMAVSFKLASTEKFRQAQFQIVKNCIALTNRLKDGGLRISFGGTDTHLGNVDCKSITGPDGTPLSGDLAARILDIAGIVLNRNTIPGDKSALSASGIRYGTPWVTERGLKEPQMIQLADIIVDVLKACTPYSIESRKGEDLRAKVDFKVLEEAKLRVRALAEDAATDLHTEKHGYPHFFYIDDQPLTKRDWVCYDLKGKNVGYFVNYAFGSDVELLQAGQSQNTDLSTPLERIKGILTCVAANHYRFQVRADRSGLAAAWLRDLSDGYVAFDADVTRRLPGPITVSEAEVEPIPNIPGEPDATNKPYYVGIQSGQGKPLPEFQWEEKAQNELRLTPLNEIHRQSGAKMVPFAGWEMPVWYSSVVEEHLATRKAAGLFDVSHMGVFQVEGDDAGLFLNSVCGNDIALLKVGESCYTHFLDPDAHVIDDTLVYRRSVDRYLVVVNASNDDKDWAWLNSVLEGKVLSIGHILGHALSVERLS